MIMLRIIKHLFTPPWALRRAWPAEALADVEAAIKAGESTHRGELRLAVEAALDLGPLLRRQSARDRALDVFSYLQVWDTAENNGVLIYVLLADRQIEIVADRGIHERVGEEAWSAVCARMATGFRQGTPKDALLTGLQEISGLLAQAFPATGPNPNELPDRPYLLR